MAPPSKLMPAYQGDEAFPKWCSKCERWQTRGDFSKHASTRDRRQKWCKKCHAQTLDGHRKRRREAGLTSYSTNNSRRLKIEVLGHYCQGKAPKCDCCGEKHIEFLSIDHLKGGGRKHRAEIGMRIYRWLKKNNYPPGYRVLCHNCNQAIGNWGYCPHTKDVTATTCA
jgi:hypothetical protein